MLNLVALVCGVLFSLGILISGMADPAKVTGFLDIAGPWDPSLALVLTGAVAVTTIPMRLAMRRQRSAVLGCPMEIPKAAAVTRRLVVGSVVFGVGWGLSGICPGPALVNLGTLRPDRLAFFGCMVVGMLAYEWWNKRVSNQRLPQPRRMSLVPVQEPARRIAAELTAQRGGEITLLVQQSLTESGRYWLCGEGEQPGAAAPCHVVTACRPASREADATAVRWVATLGPDGGAACAPQTSAPAAGSHAWTPDAGAAHTPPVL